MMPSLRSLAAPLLPLALVACASTGGGPPGSGSAQNTPAEAESQAGQTPYGLFLAGQSAFDAGHSETAAR
jgi:hypothetical protein